MKFMDLFKTTLSLKAIYEARKSPLIFTLLFFIVLNIGFSFPFALSIYRNDNIGAVTFIPEETLLAFNTLEVASVLSKLKLNDDSLILDDTSSYTMISIEDYNVLIDYQDIYDNETNNENILLRITQKYIEFNPGISVFADYQNLEGADIEGQIPSVIIDRLMRYTIKESVSQWFITVSLFFYAAFFAINGLFILGMSVLALLFRLADKVKLSYIETLNVVLYSSVMPTIVSVIIAIAFNLLGFNMILYNFGTILVYMLVRKRFLKNPIGKIA